jgi:DNA-binding GntR family transcriptional regulator
MIGTPRVPVQRGIGEDRPVTSPDSPPRTRAGADAAQVATALREAIMNGVVAPGEHIRQEQWAAQLGASRFQLREALRSLAAEGLITHDPNRGWFAARMSVDEMSQLYLMRRLIEGEVLGTVRRPDPTELAELRAAAADVERAMAAADAPETVRQERRFYFLIYDLSPLTTVAAEARRLWSLSEAYRASFFFGALTRPEFQGYVAERHRRIVDLLERGDPAALAALVREGRLAMERRLAGWLRNRDGFFTDWSPQQD